MIKNDPKNYEKMQEPFESVEQANLELEKFWKAVYKLRNKHHVMDVHIIIMVNVTNRESGNFDRMITAGHFGDGGEAEPMVAFELGRLQNIRRRSS